MVQPITEVAAPEVAAPGSLQAWREQQVRYDIIGNVSYAYEVNEATANSAFYWNACTRLNQLFAGHDTLNDYRFTEQRTRLKTDSQVHKYAIKNPAYLLARDAALICIRM